MRLNKYISESGLCSRREADRLIESGRVTVDGQRAALERLEACRFDLALVDISLADGNGFAVCAAVKANTDTLVIFLTASADEYSVVTGLDMGADDYISKPFRPRELVSRIRSVLRRYKAMAEESGGRAEWQQEDFAICWQHLRLYKEEIKVLCI